MYFKRIEIQGFKSFAEPVSIDFHEGITCIVGPNGSGKSNISDAIRWVLGEQSPKMLRGGKMEEIIFAGTMNRKSRGMAEVTLTIDNSGHILPIDYSEVAITRRMYRSGESGYFINKVPCRLKDIRELIMDTGIGVDGYSIIGQGRIADILSDKPEARREIFEEAAGIVKYRNKKEESQRKLESSRTNLDRVNDIVGEIEGRIGGLKEDSIKAAEYLKLKDVYKELEVNITLKNIENVELKNEYIIDDISQLTDQINVSKEEKETIDKEVSKNRALNLELEDLNNKGRDRLLALVEETNALSGHNRLTREKLSSIERDKERLQEEIASSLLRKEKEEGNAKELMESLEKIQLEIDSMKDQCHEKTKEVTRLEDALNKSQRLIDEQKDSIYSSYNLASEKKSEINTLLNLAGTLEKRKKQIISDGENRHNTAADLGEEHKGLLLQKKVYEDELKTLKDGSLTIKNAYAKGQNREKEITNQINEIRISKGQLSARLKMIEEMEGAYEGYNEAVKYVMGAGLSGIHGLVADLIQVPEGYEKAIETALGAALQNVVCDYDKDAQIAIDQLKKSRVGRLTFLPLTAIKSYGGTLPVHLAKEQGFKGFGAECINYHEKYNKVVEYLLGRVVIVEDLNLAVKMSKLSGVSGLRFVTLEGEVVNASGAITGGAYRNKTAGLLERKSEGKTLAIKLQQLEKEYRGITDEINTLVASMEKEKAQIGAFDEKIRENEIAMLGIDNQLSRLSSGLTDMDLLKEREERELLSIENEARSAGEMIKELKEAISLNERLIAEAEATVEKSLEYNIKAKQDLEKSKEELTVMRLEQGRALSEKSNGDQVLERIKDYISHYEKEIDQRKETILALDKEKDQLSLDDGDKERLLAEKEAEKALVENDIQKYSVEKVRVSSYLSEIEGKRETLDSMISGWQTDKHELELKLAKNETQIEGYKEKLWEDFEISYLQAMDFEKKNFVMSAAVKESREIKNRMKELGEVNIGSIKEYESVKERYEFLTEQRDDLLSAMEALVKIIEDMDRNIKKNFKDSFDQVVVNFEETFLSMFGGGSAELRLADESKPLETGIDIIVQPPGKKLQNISLLSGGEKTLTAIALMFAILKTKPTPFCILDEVEAALDEANIDRFARYLRDFKEIQFALVTHQKATMEYADVLYGVTMPEGGISKVISLKLGDEIDLN